jgi:hypothetical protein
MSRVRIFCALVAIAAGVLLIRSLSAEEFPSEPVPDAGSQIVPVEYETERNADITWPSPKLVDTNLRV